MEPLNVNLAAAQFVRRKTRETKVLITAFVLIFIAGIATTSLFFLHADTDAAILSPQATTIIPGIPPYAMSLVFEPAESMPEISLIQLPGVSVASVARWEEPAEGGVVAAEMFTADRSAQEMALGIEIFAGVSGFSLSSRRSGSGEVAYTFYKASEMGTVSIIPESASSSRVIIKQ